VVLFEDECHLKHGDSLGYVWGKKGERVEIPMENERTSQTFYGALNLITKQFHLKAFSKGNMENTVDYLKWLSQKVYPEAKRIVLIWDGASYHTGRLVQELLASVNAGLQPADWKIHCLLLAPNAPDQNPVEDSWLKAKNYVRQAAFRHLSFAKIVEKFKEAFQKLSFDFNKLNWYFS
jgi:transposase